MTSVPDFLFYLFSAVLLGAAACVVTARNPVHGVLFLILTFFNAAGLFVLAHAEFLAMMLLIVYVGAVAVLFLFVVMMLNQGVGQNLISVSKKYGFVCAVVAGFLVSEFLIAFFAWVPAPFALEMRGVSALDVANTQALGSLLYTEYFAVFQGTGLILLIAMVGAIVLTHRKREGVKRQNVSEQVARTPQDSLTLINIPLPQEKKS